MLREKLPNRRANFTREVKVNNQTVQISVGLYPDGRPGEVFIDVAKSGTVLRAWAGAAAKLVSLMLQYGVPLSEVVEALEGTNSEAWGDVPVEQCEGVTSCAGVIDFLAKLLEVEFPHAARSDGPGPWDALADALDRVFGTGEVDDDDVRHQLTLRGAEAALDTFLEVMT